MNLAWLGRLLRNVKAGEGRLVWNLPVVAATPETLVLESPAFSPGGQIPRRHAGRGVGENVSPALSWRGVPAGAVELVLLMEDPDAPIPKPYVHLAAYGVDPALGGLAEGALAAGSPGVVFGRNTAGPSGYAGPRGFPGHGRHGFHFELFALSRASGLRPDAGLAEITGILTGGALMARGRLVGTFERPA